MLSTAILGRPNHIPPVHDRWRRKRRGGQIGRRQTRRSRCLRFAPIATLAVTVRLRRRFVVIRKDKLKGPLSAPDHQQGPKERKRNQKQHGNTAGQEEQLEQGRHGCFQGMRSGVKHAVPSVTTHGKLLVAGKVRQQSILFRPPLQEPIGILQHLFHRVALDAQMDFAGEPAAQQIPQRRHGQIVHGRRQGAVVPAVGDGDVENDGAALAQALQTAVKTARARQQQVFEDGLAFAFGEFVALGEDGLPVGATVVAPAFGVEQQVDRRTARVGGIGKTA